MNQEESYKYIEDLIGKLEALTEVLGYTYEKIVTYPGFKEAINDHHKKSFEEKLNSRTIHKSNFKVTEHRMTKDD